MHNRPIRTELVCAKTKSLTCQQYIQLNAQKHFVSPSNFILKFMFVLMIWKNDYDVTQINGVTFQSVI